ncbi:hypothetical protein ACHAXS_008971 [Conticribra weissflogii]
MRGNIVATRHAASSKTNSGVDVSKPFTRAELEDACRRNKTKEIAAMAQARKRNAITRQNQRSTKLGINPVDTSSQLRSLDAGVKLCARKFNEAKAQADKLEEEVKARCDEIIGLEREAAALQEMLEGSNDDAKRILDLSEEIERTNESSERILLYRHQLNYIHRRMRKKSVVWDTHVGELSDTLSSLKSEKDCYQNMLGEVEAGFLLAKTEFDESSREVRAADEERNRELILKQMEANNASEMEEWNNERVSTSMKVNQSFGGVDEQEMERLQKAIHDRKSQLDHLSKLTHESAAEISRFEESMSHIKHSTGVNNLTEMINKMCQHDERQVELLRDNENAEARLNAAKKAFFEDQEELDKIKTNGIGNTDIDRNCVASIISSIQSEQSECKIMRSKNERLDVLLLGLRQGCIRLYDRLLPFYTALMGDGEPELNDIDSTNAEKAAKDTETIMKATEGVLSKMLKFIGGIDALNKFKTDPTEVIDSDSPSRGLNSFIRIKSDANSENGEHDNDGATMRSKIKNSSDNDDILTRAMLKNKR